MLYFNSSEYAINRITDVISRCRIIQCSRLCLAATVEVVGTRRLLKSMLAALAAEQELSELRRERAVAKAGSKAVAAAPVPDPTMSTTGWMILRGTAS